MVEEHSECPTLKFITAFVYFYYVLLKFQMKLNEKYHSILFKNNQASKC